MGETKYVLTQKDLDRLAALASEKGVAAYKAECRRAESKRANEKTTITKKKLASYRRVKASLKETEEFTEDEKIELRWRFVEDLMGTATEVLSRSEDTIISIEKKRKQDLFEIQSIERAMGLYKAEADRSKSEEFRRRYREVMAKYIDEQEKTVAEIAEEEGITEKTVYKDLGIACKIVATYLLGM